LIDAPTKVARRYIEAKWVNVCSQCDHPIHKWDRKGRPRYSVMRFFCSHYCHDRYFGVPVVREPYSFELPEVVCSSHEQPEPPRPPQEEVPAPLHTSKGVLAALNDRWRVWDGDGQWVLEYRSSDARWAPRSFHREKAALLRSIREYCGEADITALRFMPDYHYGADLLDAPRCSICGQWEARPQGGLPRSMFCIATRKRQKLAKAA
jgi:hypothetical protein